MATFTVERLPNLPIIVTAMQGSVTVEDVIALTEAYAPHMEAIDYQGFLILDIRRATANFAQMFHILRWQRTQAPGSSGVRVYMIGVNDLVRLYTDLRAKDAGDQPRFSLFRAMEDALAAAHSAVEPITAFKPEKRH